MTLDILDKKILKNLTVDARQSARQLALKLEVSFSAYGLTSPNSLAVPNLLMSKTSWLFKFLVPIVLAESPA